MMIDPATDRDKATANGTAVTNRPKSGMHSSTVQTYLPLYWWI